MPITNSQGVRLFWKQDGADARPALLLLNSILTDHSLWDHLVPFLVDHFRVIRMDMRGQGASDAPGGDYTLAELASDAWAVLDAAGVEQALLCGLSLGGLTALQMASERPERLTGIAVASCSITVQRDLWHDRIVDARQNGMRELAATTLDIWLDPDRGKRIMRWIDPLRRVMATSLVDGYCGCAAAIRDMELATVVQRIDVPTLVIGGNCDRGTSYSPKGLRIAQLVPGASEVHIAGGYLACIESPGAFAIALGRFFDQLRPHGLGLDPSRNGERVRREVLGDAWVDGSLAARDEWIADYQDYATEVAWHTIWGREGLDYRSRRLLVLAITAALGRWEEFRLHVRSGIEQGALTVQDVKEASLQAGLYAGVPVANTAFAECREIFRDMGISAGDC
jgi:3-oxoadipate enol-lactonase/4-carboxymuconolactone decarboxylase